MQSEERLPTTLPSADAAGRHLLAYYDARLLASGDTALGAAWPNDDDRNVRFDAMLTVARGMCGERPFSLCDYACGTGELLRRIRERGIGNISYVGVDASEAALRFARAKFPEISFAHGDAGSPLEAPCDVLVANGLFTVKGDVGDGEMWDFMTRTIETLWPSVRRGIAFNVMSPIVDWRRDDLFHVSYDTLAAFLHGLAGRRIGFRADYGLYEYIAYAVKE